MSTHDTAALDEIIANRAVLQVVIGILTSKGLIHKDAWNGAINGVASTMEKMSDNASNARASFIASILREHYVIDNELPKLSLIVDNTSHEL